MGWFYKSLFLHPLFPPLRALSQAAQKNRRLPEPLIYAIIRVIFCGIDQLGVQHVARITIEEAVKRIGNRFDVVMWASKRARHLTESALEPRIETENEKSTVIALREIEAGLINPDEIAEFDRDDE